MVSHEGTFVPVNGIPRTPAEARLAARENRLYTSTAGIAPNHVQANLIVLPSKNAADFRNLCALNPIACPLLAESSHPGAWHAMKSHLPQTSATAMLPKDFDIRRDIPFYMVYRDGQLIKAHCKDVLTEWQDDHIAFLIGCSYSFESSLSAAGLPPRHILNGANVPMYRTKRPLVASGVFNNGVTVVSMRPYKSSERERVHAITRPYRYAHGAPIAWGWGALEDLGIVDIARPEWGDAPVSADGRPFGEVVGDEEDEPVFWACGVTPQEAVVRAGLEGVIIGHSPGFMLILDCEHGAVMDGRVADG